jgi:hypothetical protein
VSGLSKARITQCDGSAFVHSGRGLEVIKKTKKTLSITSDDAQWNEEVNRVVQIAMGAIVDEWSIASAEVIAPLLLNPSINQVELAANLGIHQHAVSKRLARAKYPLVQEFIQYCKKKLIDINV